MATLEERLDWAGEKLAAMLDIIARQARDEHLPAKRPQAVKITGCRCDGCEYASKLGSWQRHPVSAGGDKCECEVCQ